MEKTLEQNTYVLQEDDDFGTVKIADDVVASIAGIAATEVEGVVSSIPADVTIAGNNATFVLEADLHTPFLTTSDGERIQLRPGVGAEGRIVIDRDSVLRMILRKLDFLH